MEGYRGLLLLSPFVLAELDYLLMTRLGSAPQIALLDDIARGAYELVEFSSSDVERALRVMRRYSDLEIGLADASLVVLAERYGCNTLLTLDERHFRVVRAEAHGKPFILLPTDA